MTALRGLFPGMRSRLWTHRFGLFAVLLGVLLSLPGLNWGYTECWNLDQMGHLDLRDDGLPQHYLKPPLHTYLNKALLLPATEWSLKKIFRMPRRVHSPWLLLASRTLTLAMFACSIWFLYCAARRAGVDTAVAAALLYATSSGILIFNRFLSADSPLLFWMLASLLAAIKAAESKKIAWAVVSGLLAGLATANKYNGLWAGAALPAALLCAMGWRAFLFPGFWLGGLSVPLGFAAGNPGVILDTRRFWEDFYYNLQTTPVYGGQTEGHGFARFFSFFPELLGWPGTFLLAVGLAGLPCVLWLRPESRKSCLLLLIAAGAVILPYYLSIGRFPRLETRFVLPVIPFLLLIASVGWRVLPWRHPGILAVFALVLIYNSAASLESGLRFVADPRMEALTWVRANIPENATIENTYAPHWRRMPSYRPTIRQMPAVTGRSEMFAGMLDESLKQSIAKHETDVGAAALFTPEALRERNPDFIAFSSQVFQWTGDDDVRKFYQDLADGRLGYSVVFDQEGRTAAAWSYPRAIDFHIERMLILRREDSGGKDE